MKWKKWFPWMGLVLVIVVIATYAFYQYWMGPNQSELDRDNLTEEEYERALELIDIIKEEDPLGRRQNVTRRINPQETTGLVFDDEKKLNKGNLVEAMHLMTHQKILATEKAGAIPMTHDNLKEVRDYLELLRDKNKIKSEDYRQLGQIIERWEQAIFDEIDKEQDLLLEEMYAVIGFSNGLATRAEEELFIINNFGAEYVYTMDLEPMPEEEDVNTETEE
ncbi:DUF6241 domain-containing protein [Exiguobacterium sp. B2(2022)]|uniref:DUF6241 domain-containing protein n=1 Tax=Exiguobacterium sp. B2(2022) TaxID=2992755 RepID=UPI00237BDC86|nr:DUF6241 domain-containing protein [Exiguobacterium sp. B2(2022)]MDE0562173.1 DUF6241 domain-containing protein [Exiguobacterium sp. B2(2022)]